MTLQVFEHLYASNPGGCLIAGCWPQVFSSRALMKDGYTGQNLSTHVNWNFLELVCKICGKVRRKYSVPTSLELLCTLQISNELQKVPRFLQLHSRMLMGLILRTQFDEMHSGAYMVVDGAVKAMLSIRMPRR